MSDRQPFHHALYVDQDQCNGCVHCIRVCPTHAIRVAGGKAIIKADKCIDCGNCFRVCPVRAIKVEQDDLSVIGEYAIRVALIPAVFMGQFPPEVSQEKIYGALKHLGFTYVIEVEQGAGVVASGLRRYLQEHTDIKPLISSFCPAVVRLIQVSYPSLTNHIIRLKTPHDVTSLFCHRYFADQGYQPQEIGVFYVTPCAAKIAAVNSPVGEEKSAITGTINMDFLYNRVLTVIFQERERLTAAEVMSPAAAAIKWSLSRGEVSCTTVRALAIDGIHEISRFLEKVEDGQIKGVDFIEMKACQEGCPGGILTAGNPFLTVERMEKRASMRSQSCSCQVSPLQYYDGYLESHLEIGPIEPRSGVMLDHDPDVAMGKLESIRKIELLLPGIDCGACGAPACRDLAEDIVMDHGSITSCPYMEILSIKRGQIDGGQALIHAEKVWTGRIKE